MAGERKLKTLLRDIAACRECEAFLPLGPLPVVRASVKSRVLIIGQAPGTVVHQTGVPWNDNSGDRLRQWLGVDNDAFYDSDNFALMPMGFCYPGKIDKGGDAPPRPECAPLWHGRLLALMPNVKLTLLTGMYAQKYYLATTRKKTLTETVRHWRDYGPRFLPTPHPSWRSQNFIKRNPWFETEVLPWLRARVLTLLGK